MLKFRAIWRLEICLTYHLHDGRGLEFGRVQENTQSRLTDCWFVPKCGRVSIYITCVGRKKEERVFFFCYGGIYRPASAVSGDRARQSAEQPALISRRLLPVFERCGSSSFRIAPHCWPQVDKKKEEQRMICLRANELQGRLSQTVKGLMPVIHTRTFFKIYGARSRFIAALNLLALVNWIASRWRLKTTPLIAYYGFGPLFSVCESEFIVLLKLLNCSSMPIASDARDNLWHLHVLSWLWYSVAEVKANIIIKLINSASRTLIIFI